MKFEYIAYGLLAITAIFVLINLLIGLLRGTKKTLGFLVSIAVSAIIAAVVTLTVCTPTSSLMAVLMGYVQDFLASRGDTLADIFAISEVGDAMAYYVAMIVAPLFFVVSFIVISIIMAIIAAIVVKFIPPRGKVKGAPTRLGGMAIGALCGLVVAFIILMPMVGFIDIAATAGSALMGEGGMLEDEVDDSISEIFTDASDNVIFKGYKAAGGWMFDSFSSASFEGERVNLRSEISTMLTVVSGVEALSGDVSSFGDEQLDAIDGMVDGLDDSVLLKNTVSGVISHAAGKWADGEQFMGMDKIEAGELLEPMMTSMIKVLATTTRDTVSDDLHTITDVFGVLVDHEMLSNSSDYQHMLNKLGKEGVVGELITVVNKNERMSVLSDEITKLSVRALATTLNIPKDSTALYDDLMADFTSIIKDSKYSGDERVDLVASSIMDTFEEHGLLISDEEAHTVSEAILRDLGGVSDLQSSDVEDFFIVYSVASLGSSLTYAPGGAAYGTLSAENGLTVNPDGTVSVGDRVLNKNIYSASNYDHSAAYEMGKSGKPVGDADHLASAADLAEVSTVVTLEKILEHVHKYSDCQDPDAEAQKISDMFGVAADMFSGDGIEGMTHDQIIAEMGVLLDKMRETEIFGQESVSDIMKAILQSESVKDEMGMTVNEASTFSDKLNNLVSDDYTYTDATQTVSNTINMVTNVTKEDISKEERIENTQKVLEDLDPEKSDMLSSMVTPSMVTKYGASEEKSQSVADSVSDLFDNMANFNADPGSEAYKTEADAVNKVLDLAIKGAGVEDEHLFSKGDTDGKLETSASEFVNMVVDSEVVSATMITTAQKGEENPYGVYPTDEDREDLSAAMEEYYAVNSANKSEEEIAVLQEKLNALAFVVDMPLMFPVEQ